MAFCKSCRLWNVRPDDVYCAGCGIPVVDFEFIGGSQFLQIPELSQEFDVAVAVRNTGQACVNLLVAEQAKSSTAAFQGLPFELRLLPNEEGQLKFKAQFFEEPPLMRHEISVVAAQMRSVSKPLTFYMSGEPKVLVKFKEFRDQISVVAEVPHPVIVEIYNASGCNTQLEWSELPEWLNTDHKIVEVPPCSAVSTQCSVLIAKGVQAAVQASLTANLRRLNEKSGTYELFEECTVQTPSFIPVRPPSAVVLWNRGDEQERVKTEVQLGRLVPTERRRERFTLFNAGDVDIESVTLYTQYPVGDSAFLAAFDNPEAHALFAGQELDFHIRIDASRHGFLRHRIPLLFDLGRHGTHRLDICFEINQMKPYPGVVAIDFGTSYSCVARSDAVNTPAAVVGARKSKKGNLETSYIPSVLYFFTPDDYVFGDEAKKHWSLADPGNSVFNVKRALTGGERTIRGRRFSPEELVRIMMREMVSAAMRELNRIPEHLVATVPVGFSQQQRDIIWRALLEDGTGLGQRNIQVVDEPTAAAMHYYFTHMRDFEGVQTQNVLVFDFGGGTLDVSILGLDEKGFTVLARRGDPLLGGIDMDRAVAAKMANSITEKYPDFESDAITLGRDEFDGRFGNSPMLRMRIRFAHVSEEAKIQLASEHDAPYRFPAGDLRTVSGVTLSLEKGASEYVDELAADHFPEMIAGLLDDAINVIENALHAAGLNPGDIDLVLMTGQVCKTKCLRDRVNSYFEGSRARIPDFGDNGFDFKSCVAMGAAKLSQVINRRQFAEHIGKGVGQTGYFEMQGPTLRFVQVLADNHPFGSEGQTPIVICLDEIGHHRQDIYQNLGADDAVHNPCDADFIHVGFIDINQPELAGKSIDLFLGLDSNGHITARIDQHTLPVTFVAEHAKDAW